MRALAGTGVEVKIAIPNEMLAAMNDYENARNWCYQSGIRAGLSEGADANSQRRDQLALGQIHQGVDYSIFGLIANAKTAKEAWDTLKLSYKGVDRAQKSKLQSLRRLYDRCEMSSTETVEHYFSRLTDLVNKMRLYGDKIGDDAVVEKILRTIPLKYDHVVASIQESHDIELLTIAELKGMIESHIDRIEAKTETPANEEALKSQVFSLTLLHLSVIRRQLRHAGGRLDKVGFGNLPIVVGAIGWPTEGDTNANATLAEKFYGADSRMALGRLFTAAE
ncbi:hypothetical protein ZIOFF_008940 [Zingiber officinale]|uniref:Uncharacterized protein n=1 Tax=Zingiber officinale TaxID=94328 RepID=A0A8J5HTE1_ZINOF|nr:hypothetical protein ZIOFF_008940 [Zingiber officinale]